MALSKPPAAGQGTRLGKYELVKELTGSGVATTWLARIPNDGTGSLFTVLRLHKHITKNADAAEALIQEGRRAQKLDHLNVLRLVETGVTDGEVFVVSEHLEGDSLANLMRNAGPAGLPQPVVLRIALDVATAIARSHALNEPLVHGELNPWCIHIGLDGATRVAGFGVHRALSQVGLHGIKNHDRLSYAAPERVKAMAASGGTHVEPVEPSCDLFSAGVILWEGLTRKRLFSSRMEAAIIQKVLTSPVPKPSASGVKVPETLENILMRCLAREPADRLSSAEVLAGTISSLDSELIGSTDAVMETLEKLSGRSIANRHRELETALEAPRGGASRSVRPPRAKTLMGMAVPRTDQPVPAGPPAPKPTSEPAPPKQAPPEKPASPTKPAAPARRVATLMGIAVPSDGDIVATDLEGKPFEVADPPTMEELPEELLVTFDSGVHSPETDAAPAKKPPAPPLRRPKAEPAPEAKKAASAPTAKLGPPPDTFDSDLPPARGTAGRAVEGLAPGATLGRYTLLSPIARGGMASVWLARISSGKGAGELCAIKTMLPDVSDDADFEKMFFDEARVAAKIHHENVVEVLELGESEDVLFLAMEYVDGDSVGALQRAAKTLGGIPANIVAYIAMQTCAGLHAAHELADETGKPLDLVHRDISPGNILLTAAGQVKIVDFGIAKSKGRLHVTRVGSSVKGKTPYLSPEQLSTSDIDRRADIFSLGALTYVLSTGLHPFRGESELKTIENIALKKPVSIRNILPSFPEALEKVILKALEKNAADRFSSAAEMQAALEEVAGQLEPVTAADVSEFQQRALSEPLARRKREVEQAIRDVDGEPTAAPSPVVAAPVQTKSRPSGRPLIEMGNDRPPEELAATSRSVPPASARDEHDAERTPGAAERDVGPLDLEDAPETASSGPNLRRRRMAQMTVTGVVAGFAILGLLAIFSDDGSGPEPTQPTPPPKTAAVPPPPPPAPTAIDTGEEVDELDAGADADELDAGEDAGDEPDAGEVVKPKVPPRGTWKPPPAPPKKYNPPGI